VTVRNLDLLEIIIGIHAAIRDSIEHASGERVRTDRDRLCRGSRQRSSLASRSPAPAIPGVSKAGPV
jgi:hypothetical protein